jgi:hypothetical protein
MLCFVMALKSPAASANWSVVERLFEQTLTSVCNQDDPDFRVIVVCNQVPRLSKPAHHSVQFLVKDLPVPDVKAKHPHFITETMLDKWTKLAHGLVVAGDVRPDFVMLMDADDLVSRRLASFANRNKASNGWIFRQGYYWRYGTRWMEWTEHFNCGTNSIVSSRFINFPKKVSNANMQDCVVLKNGHVTIERAMRERGTPLEPLPFSGAAWVSGHGDNDTTLQGDDSHGKWHGLRFLLGSIRRRRFLSSALKREFGLLDLI